MAAESCASFIGKQFGDVDLGDARLKKDCF
jgi:hypothetical protein